MVSHLRSSDGVPAEGFHILVRLLMSLPQGILIRIPVGTCARLARVRLALWVSMCDDRSDIDLFHERSGRTQPHSAVFQYSVRSGWSGVSLVFELRRVAFLALEHATEPGGETVCRRLSSLPRRTRFSSFSNRTWRAGRCPLSG